MIRTNPQSPSLAPATPASICCIECERPWDIPSERWRLKLLVDDVESFEAVPYCPDCHAREFGA